MTDDLWRVEYLYRDASNYKFWGEFVVSGRLSLDALRPYLFDGEYFVPQAIGIASLVPAQRNDDDHELHSFQSIEPILGCRPDITVADLYSRVRIASRLGWFGAIDVFIFQQKRVGRALTAVVES